MRALFVLADMENLVIDVLGLGLIARHIHFDRIGAELIGGVQNVEIQSGAKDHELTLFGNALENELHIVFKAHVEHAIGLVENDAAHLLQVDQVLFEKIDQTSGSSDDEFNSVAQTFLLLVVRDTSVNRNRSQAGITNKLYRVLIDLFGQFSRWNQNQNELIRPPVGEHALFSFGAILLRKLLGVLSGAHDALHERQKKRGGFSGSGLRQPRRIAALDDVRHGCLLNRGCVGEAKLVDRGLKRGMEIKFSEFQGNLPNKYIRFALQVRVVVASTIEVGRR